MAQGFFLAYFEKGLYITNNLRIFINYMKTGFVVDCIVVLPEWCLIILNFSDEAHSFGELGKILKGARAVRIARMLRAFRVVLMLKFKGIISRIHDIIQNEHTFIVVSLVQLMGFILICNHLFACIWYAIGSQYWHSGRQSWLVSYETMLHSDTYMYATSLHWSLTQFTPAGMGVSATNNGERVFSIFVLIFAMVCFSSMVGGITSFMTQLRSLSHSENKQLWLMRLYLKQNNVPGELSSRIQKYIEHLQRRKNTFVQVESVLFIKELSPELSSELTHQVFSHQLLLHPLFNFVDSNMKSVI